MEATTFLPADKELLIRVVKDSQKSKLQGTQGSWKDYLKAQIPALSKSDPSMHSAKVSLIQTAHGSRKQCRVEVLLPCRRWLLSWQP